MREERVTPLSKAGRWPAAVALLLLLFAAPARPAAEAPEPETAFEVASRLEIVVNIPAYRLDAVVDGEVLASFPVTVGAPHEPTPDGRFVIDRLVWNPWWHPPAHRRPRDQVTPPGPRNPMGRVKLHFAADLYFIHGTAKTGELEQATSRGCIRLRNEDAMALAALVHEYAGPELSPKELDRLVRNPGATRHLTLDRPVRLRILYDLVELSQTGLDLHQDVYKKLPS